MIFHFIFILLLIFATIIISLLMNLIGILLQKKSLTSVVTDKSAVHSLTAM